MTFKPRFEDFESVTKAIGEGSQVNQLLVHVYEEGSDQFEEKTYTITECQVQQKVKIPFYYGKKYKVYFWAYKSGEKSPYTISTTGLKGGVSVNYPTGDLAFDTLESLDAFYAVSDVDLSNGRTIDVNLTRPFAQVNLVADNKELLNAQATKVEFTINVAKTFNLSSQKVEGATKEQTFTFTSFQTTEEINVNVYLGTTYLFVPSSGKVTGTVKLYAGNNVLKSAENIEIPLVSNKRTNLVFSGFQVTVPDWDSNKETVPGESDGWITITEPEQLAALLMTGTTENTQVRIGSTLNMEKMPQRVKDAIAGKSFNALTLDGNNLTIKNFAAPAFFANATNLTVSNLTLENVNITAATHVGVLVNELKGNGTFTNVTVKGSSATTTNGAAGGFVGRSIRTSEKERSEALALTFTDCRVEGTDAKNIVATGSEAEGKFVGLFTGYDNGEKLVFTKCTSEKANVADYKSRYVEGNEGAWLAGNDYSAYNGFLGDETYLRGKVYFGGENEAKNRFCPKWDGTTNTTELDIEPLLANDAYDAGTTAGNHRYVVYSAFDLAGVRKKTAKPSAIYLMNNVDMFGYGPDGIRATPLPSRPSLEVSDDNLFTPFEQVSYLEGNSFTIYNLSVEEVHNTNLGGTAFIRMASGTTTHQNLTLSNPDIKAYSTDPISDGNAYAGTLVCTTSGTYNALKINVVGGNLFAICKAGGLCGRISTGTTNLSNCTVNGLTLSNYDTGYFERFLDYDILGYSVQIDFNSDGEIGGLVGFIIGNASITNCTVENCNFYCTGEEDWTLNVLFAAAKVPGRHVNEFIGDIRTTKGEIVTITNYTIKNNNMHTSQTATNGEKYRSDKYKEFKSRNAKTWECVGFVYAVTIKFGDIPGNVKINNSAVFVSESMRK